MIVDTSVIVALFRKEPERDVFAAILAKTAPLYISAASALEASIVLMESRETNPVKEFLAFHGIEIAPVTASQAFLAADAYRRYGKGQHEAKLNFGDCFAYALAKEMDAPLLFKGKDFTHTDVKAAA